MWLVWEASEGFPDCWVSPANRFVCIFLRAKTKVLAKPWEANGEAENEKHHKAELGDHALSWGRAGEVLGVRWVVESSYGSKHMQYKQLTSA